MNITEEKINIQSDINIGATIAYQDKEEKRPLVILISGTGSLDRDGNALGFKTNLYKDLSDMFVNMGFTCIRYDKRGTHESKTKKLNFGLTEYTDDVATIIKYAKTLDFIDKDKIVVCGHSEGAMVATLLTKKEDLRGIILLAGACMSLKDVSLYQNYLLIDEAKDMKGILGWFLRKTIKPEQIEEKVEEVYKKAEQSKKDTFFYQGSILPTKYIKEHGSLTKEDYIKILKEYKGKILAITGKHDVQADYRKLELLEKQENITIYTPEELNHMLRDIKEESSIMEIKKEYKKCLKEELSPNLKQLISNWTKTL